MIKTLFLALIAALPVDDSSVIALHNSVENCENSYHAELITAKAVVKRGCWAPNPDSSFWVKWDGTDKLVLFPKNETFQIPEDMINPRETEPSVEEIKSETHFEGASLSSGKILYTTSIVMLNSPISP